jgi:hypothetical protein
MTSRRQEKRRNQRKQGQQVNQAYPVKLFDEDTGQNIQFLSAYCPVCKHPEPSLYTLAEWSPEEECFIAKVTGRAVFDGKEENTFDFYCYTCGEFNADTDVMKRFVEYNEKEIGKVVRFPDEYFAASVQRDKANHPEIMAEIRRKADHPQGVKTLNRWRQSKTYRGYPKSLSDEDRLFMTLFSWDVRLRHVMKSLPNDEARMKEFDKIMKLEGIPDSDRQ